MKVRVTIRGNRIILKDGTVSGNDARETIFSGEVSELYVDLDPSGNGGRAGPGMGNGFLANGSLIQLEALKNGEIVGVRFLSDPKMTEDLFSFPVAKPQ
jgi:hypothetical protein